MIGGVIHPRTPYNSVECLAQMIVRVKPIMDKITRKIEKGFGDQILNIIQDIRVQMEDCNEDINSDTLNREISPRVGRSYSLFDAYEILAYKVSMALNDNVVPNFMPYFYVHFEDTVLPYLTVQINEEEFLDDILKRDLKSQNKKLRNFGDLSIPTQLVFIKIERQDSVTTPLKLRQSLDLTEFGGSQYQLFMICNTKNPGTDNSIIMYLSDPKGWITVDPLEINPVNQFTLAKETRHTSIPTIFVGYIQGKSNVELFRPGAPQSIKGSSHGATSFVRQRELERAENVTLERPRTLNINIFDPAKMAVQKMPEVQFRSTDEYKNAIRSLRNNLVAKGNKTSEIYFRKDENSPYEHPPIDIPEENAELIGDITGSLGFLNDYMNMKPISVSLVNLTKPDFYKIKVNFAPFQKVSNVREYVNRCLATALNLPQKNRNIFYWDGEAYQITDDDAKIDFYENKEEAEPLEFYFTTDNKVPDGAHVIRIRFVDVNPAYTATDAPFSFNQIETVDKLVNFAQKKFGFPDIDFFTFQEQGPQLYMFPQMLAKTREGKKLSPMIYFEGVKSPLFAQSALHVHPDTAVLSFVLAENLNPLQLTNDAFRLPFDVAAPYKEVKAKLRRVLEADKLDIIYVVNNGDKVNLADDMVCKSMTKGVFFVKIIE